MSDFNGPPPPLPTEPCTVIRAQDNKGHEAEMILRGPRHWQSIKGDLILHSDITGFEVLAEPPLHIVFKQDEEHDAEVRRETAKAVLDRVREYSQARCDNGDYSKIAREFGVES